MPIKNNNLVCINDPSHYTFIDAKPKILYTIEGYKNEEPQVNFKNGTSVRIFVCADCGYTEMYWAEKLHEIMPTVPIPKLDE